MAQIKTLMKSIIPSILLDIRRRRHLSRIRKANQTKPIKEVFTSIYEQHLWGRSVYCSGSGSSDQHAAQYASMVNSLILEKGITSLLDLGCGDFVVGKALRRDRVKYVGIDIVDGLITRNQESYGDDMTSFMCRDIIEDPLPEGDLCMLRQVLQHLSNSQISSVLKKITKYKYKYVLVTEHYPAPFVKSQPNLDKPHGPDTRIYDNSAVYLDLPPFNVRSDKISLVLDISAEAYLVNKGERLRTFMIENCPT